MDDEDDKKKDKDKDKDKEKKKVEKVSEWQTLTSLPSGKTDEKRVKQFLKHLAVCITDASIWRTKASHIVTQLSYQGIAARRDPVSPKA